MNRLEAESVDAKYKEMERDNNVIKFHNLRKKYSDLEAVRNLNLTVYKDQIFVLLGHNGAGKTTTISMLTGMIEPTSGNLEVLGDVEVSEIRKKIGMCPQHDTLYDDLTVKEHLELFSRLKGLDGPEGDAEVNKLIADVNLE